MDHVRHKLFAAMLIAAACAAHSQAVTLAPGKYDSFLDINGNLAEPASNLASDSSLAGTVIAQLSRALSMTVVSNSANPFLPPTEFVFTAVIEDWVVRRADTGRLDFYMRIDPPDAQYFGGSITRPTAFAADMIAPLTVGYRSDLLSAGLTGSAPSSVSRSADGKLIQTNYRWTDDYNISPVIKVGAPVYFRSNAKNFVDNALGSVNFYYYDSSGRANQGSTSFAFFAPSPVPEPGTVTLMFAGLSLMWLTRKRQKRD